MEVREGALFGFLGANGAGKTTTMRMILDLFRPDSGQITWNGSDVRKVPRQSFGYLPEERGLYRKKKIEELSKGNQQKVQFLATILHDPTILVMDEPFSGLDPVNANVLKEALLEMHRRGKTIIFSTHQLEQAEELCQDIVIINQGQSVVQGSVREVKRKPGRQVARLTLDNDAEASWLDTLAG